MSSDGERKQLRGSLTGTRRAQLLASLDLTLASGSEQTWKLQIAWGTGHPGTFWVLHGVLKLLNQRDHFHDFIKMAELTHQRIWNLLSFSHRVLCPQHHKDSPPKKQKEKMKGKAKSGLSLGLTRFGAD